MARDEDKPSEPPRLRQVVIVGGGFAGLEAAKALRRAPVNITLIDRQNHHCFQPLLYQVATAALSPADIAWPIRAILRRQRNLRVLMTEARGVDTARNWVMTDAGDFPFDDLVVATGATHAYFGHDAWASDAPGLKRLEDATEIRRRVLTAFEEAEASRSPARRRELTTFVVVGGGPTGVEMAGAICDLARQALPHDFCNVDPASARVILVEAGPRVLPAFPEHLSAYAAAALARMGVEVRAGAAVTDLDAAGVVAGGQKIAAGAVVWAAGVRASPIGAWLGAARDPSGRVLVTPELNAPGHPHIYIVGDTASVPGPDGRPVPGLASAAKQMGAYAGRRIAALSRARPDPGPFGYNHQGDLATLGRNAAIVKLNRLELRGFAAWAFWSVVHIYFLIGLRNRIAVAFSWVWDYMTYGRRARLITRPGSTPGP